MASRKEDEKNEATIRRLLKLPENKRCINCNSMGPQYVCTTFATFVCTQCSGIHREFSHRIKSVSMAKFTAAEVSALQAGGNERARQIFFRSMGPAQNSLPDSGSPDMRRDFIKRVYDKRLYTGDRAPSAQQEEPVVQVHRPDNGVDQPSDLRGLSLENHVGKHSFNRRNSDLDRGQAGKMGSPKSVGSPQAAPRPTHPHSYDDRDERNEVQSPQSTGRERRQLSRPFSFRDFDSTPPPAQCISDILGGIPGLRVEVFKHPNGDSVGSPGRSQEFPVDARKTWHSQSFGAIGDDRISAAALAHKRINSASLIDISGGTGATGVSRGTEDSFAEPAQVSSTTTDSWATFSTSPTPPAPPGYPAPESESSQWADSGWGQQTSTQDAWSSFEKPSPPQGVPNQEHFNALSPSESQSTSFGQPPRQRRQLPQDFFAPSFEHVKLPNLDTQQHQQIQPAFHPPQLDPPVEAYQNQDSHMQMVQAQAQARASLPVLTSVQAQDQNQVYYQPQMPPQSSPLPQQMPFEPPTPSRKSRNPFDDDYEDDSSASLAPNATTGISMQFLDMDALQAALPPTVPVSRGVSNMEAVPTTEPHTITTGAASPDWAYSFTQFNDASASSGPFNFAPETTASPYQMPSFTMQPHASGGYMPAYPFAQEAPYPSNQFYTQNVVRPAGGNPFA